MDAFTPVGFLDDVHEKFPDVFILPTEACAGSVPYSKHVILGSWERGEQYGHSIMEVCFTKSILNLRIELPIIHLTV